MHVARQREADPRTGVVLARAVRPAGDRAAAADYLDTGLQGQLYFLRACGALSQRGFGLNYCPVADSDS